MKNIMKIYLAGGMSNLTFEQQNEWREHIIKKLKNNNDMFWHKYILDIINPVQYYNFESVEYKTQKEVMEYDLNHVRTSDLIIVNFNDPKSIGTAMEIMLARELHIPIIGLNTSNKELHPWLIESCTRICETMDELINHITDFYIS